MTGDVVAFDVAHMCPSRHFPFTASACLTAATNEGFESEAGRKKRGRNLESTPDRVAQFWVQGRTLN